jgi:hypothetical protein
LGPAPKESWWRKLRGFWSSPKDNLVAYRRLAIQLHYELPRDTHARCAVVASPTDQERDASPAVALAICLADELQTNVLLLDACPRYPVLTQKVGAPPLRLGFSNLLEADDLALNDLILPSNHPLVQVLPAGGSPKSLQPALPDRVESVIDSSMRTFDFVVIAAGSVLNDPLCLALAPFVGCVLLTIMETQTRKSDLCAAKTLLDSCKARKVALLLNAPGRRNLQAV